MKFILIFCVAIALIGGLLWFTMQKSLAGIESPEHTVELSEGNFEIRTYPTLTTAATTTENQNSGFGKLFKFISGENKDEKKIAMTSPVFMPANEEGKTMEMMFVVPKDVVSAGVPQPNAKDVSIKTVTGGRFAVIRSSGRMDDGLKKSLLTKLQAEVTSRKLEISGNPIYAGYDPPWTPGPIRRNEVMLRLK